MVEDLFGFEKVHTVAPRAITKIGEPRAFLEQSLKIETDECIIWPYATAKGAAKIGKFSYVVSRIICEKVYGAPPTKKHEAAHCCGKGHLGCINWKHLRWATHQENDADKIIHGTSNRGRNNGSAKLREQDVIEIRKLASTVSKRAIADIFRVDDRIIRSIVNYEKWSWLESPEFKYNGPQLF
jgi:hypothetical protein